MNIPLNRIDVASASRGGIDVALPLLPSVAGEFADALSARVNAPPIAALLTSERKHMLARAITRDGVFPFTATYEDGLFTVRVCTTIHSPVLKDISDGVTSVCADFVRQSTLPESSKLSLALLFQKPLYDAYRASGLDDGPHTRYTTRSC